MARATYKDLGRDARSLFGDDYYHGFVKFIAKSKTCTNNDVKFTGSHRVEDGSFASFFETKMRLGCGVTSKLRVESGWCVTNEVEICDRIARGLKTSIISSLDAIDGKKNLRFNNNLKFRIASLNLNLNFSNLVPDIDTELTLGEEIGNVPLMVGARAHFKPATYKPDLYAVGAAYKARDLEIFSQVNESMDVDFTVFHASTLADLGFCLKWRKETREPSVGVAFLYRPNKLSYVKGKVNDQSVFSFVYGLRVAEGVSLSFSTQFDGKNFKEGKNELGLNLDITA